MNEGTGITEFFHQLGNHAVAQVHGKVVTTAPPVGATVRYHGSMTADHGLYRVVEVLGDAGQVNRHVVIRNDAGRELECNGRSVTQVDDGDRPVIPVWRAPEPEAPWDERPLIPVGPRTIEDRRPTTFVPAAGKIVWYRGTLEEFHGPALIVRVSGEGLELRAGPGGRGELFYCRPESVGRVSVAVVTTKGNVRCGYCRTMVRGLGVRHPVCRACHQRIVAVATAGEPVPSACVWPRVPFDTARRTCQ